MNTVDELYDLLGRIPVGSTVKVKSSYGYIRDHIKIEIEVDKDTNSWEVVLSGYDEIE